MNKILNIQETESKRVDSYTNRYNFISPSFLFFPVNHANIEEFDNAEDRVERGKILLDIKRGDRS